MRIRIGDLRQAIREECIRCELRAWRLSEAAQYYPEVSLMDGSQCPWGDPKHVKEMQELLAALQNLKGQVRYGTAARSRYAGACTQLKTHINKALKTQEPLAVQPPRTFSSLESGHDKGAALEGDDNGTGVGKSGYGRGAPAHGRYNPGQANEGEKCGAHKG